MKLLILGGTIFVGRHLVEIARERGHEVTLFNRGQHNPELFPEVEKLRGDRDGDLSALRGRRWDAVIDTSGYVPRVVRQSAEQLADAIEHYTFISSISVYADFSQPGLDENAAVGRLEDESVEEVTGETYGPLKALCEQAVLETMPDRALIIRPGLIVGPYDPTDRFTYWVRRVAQGGEVLAPERPGVPVQIIDVRDLSSWTLDMIEASQTGIYNATGLEQPYTMGELLTEAWAVSGSGAAFTWVNAEFLLAQGVQPWTEMPLWVPSQEAQYRGFSSVDVSKAIAAGLSFRDVGETVADTLAWDSQREDAPLRAGLSREREEEVLEAWHEDSKQ